MRGVDINTIMNSINTEIAKSYHYINPFDELINIFPIMQQMSCGVLVQSGELQLCKCSVTLAFINKNNKLLIPGVVANEGSTLKMTDCSIKGNLNHDTIGG